MMTKKEIASIICLLLSIGIFIIVFQLEKGDLRSFCSLFGIFFLVFSMDPSFSFFKRKGVGKNTQKPVIERTPLSSEEPLDDVDIHNTDIYLVIQESYSDEFLCCHYVDGSVSKDEIYVTYPDKTYYRLDIDELPEFYLNLCDVAEEKKNGNIDYLCSISSTDFEHVRNGFLDSKIEEKENAIRKSRDNSNRIARFVVNLMVFLTFISLMVGLEIFIESFIPYHDGKTYIVIFVLMTIVCLSALCYSFTDRAWIARRSKWIGENLHVKKMKWTDGVTLYVADNDNNPTYFMYYQEKHLFFYYHTIEFPITKEVQLLPVQMMKMEKWVKDNDYIIDYDISNQNYLGRFTYQFGMAREQATKAHLLEIREWLETQAANKDSSFLLFQLSNGDYYVEYGQRMIKRIIYIDKDGNKEKACFDEHDNDLHDGLSINTKRFLIDFFDHHAQNASSYHILTQEQFLEIWE
jgi:hypothetical protein